MSEAGTYLSKARSGRRSTARDDDVIKYVAQRLHANQSMHLHTLGKEADFFGSCSYCILQAGRAIKAQDETVTMSNSEVASLVQAGTPQPAYAYKLGDVAEIVFTAGWQRATFIPNYFNAGGDAWVWASGHCAVEHVRKVRLIATATPVDDHRPHSRSCGINAHPHGTACGTDCPTCGGKT